MANIDVSELLSDPDFTDEVTLIKRSATTNAKGRNELTETASLITAVVQGPDSETLAKYPDLANWSDKISVWYAGELSAQSPGGYSDVILWSGKRYEVKHVDENYLNYGSGWTMAVCVCLASLLGVAP